MIALAWRLAEGNRQLAKWGKEYIAKLDQFEKLVKQEEGNRPRSSVPTRSESVLGAITYANPAALNARLTVLQGVGPTRAASLAELG